MHHLSYPNTNFRYIFFFFSVELLTLLFYPSMESTQANTKDNLHVAQTTNEEDLLDDDLPSEYLFQDLLDDDLGLPAKAKFRRCSSNIERNDFQDNLLAAQPTNEQDDGDIVRRRRRVKRAALSPSFEREITSPERQRTLFDFQCGDIMTRQSVPGHKKVVVRRRTSIVRTNGTVCMEGDEEIDEEQAVCKFCFDILKEDENILKTECKCKILIHEACAANQSSCKYCKQEVGSFLVTLLRGLGSAQRMDTQESNKQSYFSRLIS
ncbi:uncharacterized protein LOC130783064 isoform X2 [Actinidia eriantha]|uniref:uncharacterized protein LOC130783064 isoform X2 n=1 Tax=Actinidia eriantha TaxID=165200 RepID=UPI002586039F|nr:uncharacterized protein LOC130783064 isoform X2 [Actinidia eriantha]